MSLDNGSPEVARARSQPARLWQGFVTSGSEPARNLSNPERIHFLSVSRCPAGRVAWFESSCALRDSTSRTGRLARSRSGQKPAS